MIDGDSQAAPITRYRWNAMDQSEDSSMTVKSMASKVSIEGVKIESVAKKNLAQYIYIYIYIYFTTKVA